MLKHLYTTRKYGILFYEQQKIKPNPTHSEMKTARKINKEEKKTNLPARNKK